MNPHLLFVVALAAEARPLLTHYGLKRVNDAGFSIYAKGSTYLVISGIGKINAAAATAHALSRLPHNGCAINIGIAGSDSPLGTLFRANRITDGNPASQQALYPPQIFQQHFPGRTVSSVDQPETNYTETEVFDMEAHAFCTTARRYLTAECVQSLKVISDNPQTPLLQENNEGPSFKLSKQFVTDLIEPHLPEISRYASELVGLASTLPAKCQVQLSPDTDIASSELIEYFIQKMHFTDSQEKLLENILNRYAVLKRPLPFSIEKRGNIGDPDFVLSNTSAKPPDNSPGSASGLLKELQKHLDNHYPSYMANQ